MHHIDDPTPIRAARIAGIGYVALFALAIFANFFVRVRLIDPDDATATFRSLHDDELLLRLAILGFLAVFVIDVVVAWALQHVFAPVGSSISMLTAWFRIVYTVFMGVAVVFLLAATQLTGDTAHVASLDQSVRETHTMLALEAFNATWMIGLVCFGVHLILAGAIMLRSRLAPALLAIVLVIAGAAYIFDTIAYTMLNNYDDHQAVFTSIVAVPSVIAELAFTTWLLRYGTRRADHYGELPESELVRVR